MKILITASEVAELAPVGGIAEYVLGLASALLRKGHDVRLAIPAYAYLRNRKNLQTKRDRLVVRLGVGASEITAVFTTSVSCSGNDELQLPVFLLGEHKHFAHVRTTGEIYQWPNHEPWIAFSRAVIDFLFVSDWQPEVIHCQDAHTALIPVYINQLRALQPKSYASQTKTVLTIHNLLNQGTGVPELLAYAGLPSSLFAVDGFEFYGSANSFKAGLLAADQVNTVSKTYAREICTGPDLGFGLEGVLRDLSTAGKLVGIVNGIDDSRWRLRGLRYDGKDTPAAIEKAKKSYREQLFPSWQWQTTGDPVIAFRSRWDNQKGCGLLVEALPQIVSRARVIIVTWGTPGGTPELHDLWDQLQRLAQANPDRLLVNPEGIPRVDQTAEHYAIADFFLVPSQYEPCGLTQMECQRYGTIPIVRATGGLVDTVSEEPTVEFPSPNGFTFKEMRTQALVGAIERALITTRDVEMKQTLLQNGLRQKNDWNSRVLEYEILFGKKSK